MSDLPLIRDCLATQGKVTMECALHGKWFFRARLDWLGCQPIIGGVSTTVVGCLDNLEATIAGGAGAKVPEKTSRQLAEEHFASFKEQEPERASLVEAEVQEISRGNFQAITFDLDPLSAWHLAGAVDLALSHPQFPQTPRPALVQLFDGIVERLTPQFPELARQLVIGRVQRGNRG